MEIAEFCGLDVAQIHGEISENLYLNLKDLGCEIWQALSVGEVLPNVTKFADLVLYDCKGENLGGNGKSFNWNLLKNLKPFSFGLAGGIGEENVSEALKFNPKIIDINSKVEDENLQKIPQKVERILQIIKVYNV
ncbi:phosphoribosylanthranilate isomerase [Campylobacter mucosalis]|uniref:phosphoribosylanthranilate isomerase n=1 Tax=Campylobacter mucosalis TaxID=202 RepID=UPI0009E3C892